MIFLSENNLKGKGFLFKKIYKSLDIKKSREIRSF